MLARFAAVGGLGFAVDASVLTLLVSGLGWNLYSARAVSFALAVTVTWLCNRSWVFRKTRRTGIEYARYFTVQIVGAAINLGTYVLAIQTWPALGAWPVGPLAIGAAIALVFNFVASRTWVFASPAPPGPATALESSYSGRENLEAMKFARNYNRYLIDLIRAHAVDGEVLDFGAGAGTFAAPVAAAGFDVACVEPDDDLQRVLRDSGLRTYSRLDELEPASVDYIYTLNVLEHIEDDAAALRELAARLRPGGRLLIYVPAFPCLYSSMDRKVGHFRRYRRESLTALVEAAGLRVEQARYADCAGFFASIVFKLLGNDTGEISPRSVALYDRFAFPLSRAADSLLSRVLGKNLLVVGSKAPGALA